MSPIMPIQPMRGFSAPARRTAQLFDPAMQASMLQQLANRSLSGLSRVVNVLDLPASMVRDVAATVTGTPTNPFDQLLTPFGPENRITGRELLRQWGAAGPEDTWGNFAGSVATETVLDPFFWLTGPFAGMTRAAKTASKLGLMGTPFKRMLREASETAGRRIGAREGRMLFTPRNIIEAAPAAERSELFGQFAKAAGGQPSMASAMLDEKLGGLFGVGPLSSSTMGVIGTGETAQKLARGADVVGESIRYSKPGMIAARLFNAPTMGARTREFQEHTPELFDYMTKGRGETKTFAFEMANEIDRLSKTIDPATRKPFLDASEEGYVRMRRIFEGFEQGPGRLPDLVPRAWGEFREVIGNQMDVGIKIEPLKRSFGEYWSRYAATPGQKIPKGLKGRELKISDVSALPREDYLKGIPGETGTLMELFKASDAQVRALNPLLPDAQKERAIANWIAGWRSADRITQPGMGGRVGDQFWIPKKFVKVADDGTVTVGDRHIELAKKILHRMSPEERITGLYADMPLSDYIRRMQYGKDSYRAVDAILDVFAENADVAGFQGRLSTAARNAQGKLEKIEPGQGFRRLGDVLESTGKEGSPNPGLNLNLGDDTRGALRRFADKIGWKGSVDDLAQMPVREDLVGDAVRLRKIFEGPEAAEEMIQMIDSATNLFKAGVTATWPAFHVRNLLSGTLRNYIAGMNSVRDLNDMRRIIRGEVVQNAHEIPIVKKMLLARSMPATAENGTEVLRELMGGWDVVGRYTGEQAARTGVAAGTAPRSFQAIIGEQPGQIPFSKRHVVADVFGRSPDTYWDPVRGTIRGVQRYGIAGEMAQDTTWGLVKAGEEVGYAVEAMNRGAPFLNLLRKGWSPQAAARKVAAAQVEYGGRFYTPFERQVMQRAFPFWKFGSRNLPWVMRELVEKPGGALGQTMRQVDRMRGENAFLPEYLSETAVIPLPSGPSGDPRFITGLGLMFEPAVGMFPGGSKAFSGDFPFVHPFSAQSTLGEIGSQLNPIPRLPIEWMFGESLFQRSAGRGGRELTDVDPTIARLFSNIRDTMTGEKTYRVDPFLGTGFEALAMASPASRLLTSLRTAADPRKGIGAKATNLLTGVRITDVPQRTRDAVLNELITQMLLERGGRLFQKPYLPKGVRERATSEEMLENQALMALSAMLSQSSRQPAARARWEEMMQRQLSD